MPQRDLKDKQDLGANPEEEETIVGDTLEIDGSVGPTLTPHAIPLIPPVETAPLPTTGTGRASRHAPLQSGPPSQASQPKRSETIVQEPSAGTYIHHYEIIRLLGRGGMGTVFLARDTRLGRRVAIKFLRTQSPELTKRFILEARTTAACSHENIVVIYEVDAWQGSPFMVFEYLQGKTLTKFISNDKALPPARAVELIVPVVRALAAAHSSGVVHRDLKPDNILITDAGITKVLDFGIAKVLQEQSPMRSAVEAEMQRPHASDVNDDNQGDPELTRKGVLMGTLSYMAPEQWGIDVQIDHRADIWAVGIMLYKMMAGKHPLDPQKGQQLFNQLMVTGNLDSPTPKLADKGFKHVPRELAAVVDRCLFKRKEHRWPDAVSLLRALEPFMPGRYQAGDLQIDDSPYTGLAPFQEADAKRFFGRSQEIIATVNHVRERPMVAIVGPSGAGKSSFVRAGLVPALKRSGEAWESLTLRPGRTPLTALASLVSPLAVSSSTVEEELDELKKLAGRLAREPGYLGAVLRSKARREKKNIILFIDQFEELYTLVPDEEERKAFTALLSAVADDPTSPIRLVVVMRSDFLDRVSEDQRFLAELSQGLVFLTSPGTDGLREALVQPAELAGYKFESVEIVEDMIAHLATTQGALPLLQFAATRLWENRDPSRKLLTQASYQSIGGVAGALASHADAVVSKFSQSSQALARSLFLRLVTPERTRALVSIDELKEVHPNASELKTVLNELVQARLLVVQTGGGGAATVEIVHESLLHSWPTLKRWLDESGEDAAFLEQLRSAARQWKLNDHSHGLLWRGELAEEAARFKRRYQGTLPRLQQAFLEGVIDLTAREARRRRLLMVGGVVFLCVLLAAAMVALVIIRQSQFEAQTQALAARQAEAGARKAEQAARKAETVAREAEGAAKANLEIAEKKERERAAAQAKAERIAKQLRVKQQELVKAFRNAKASAAAARAAQRVAQKNALAAEEAKARTEIARLKVQELLAAERERAKRLEEHLGSPLMEVLK